MPVEVVIWHIIFLQLMEKSRKQLRSLCLWWTFGVTTKLGIHNYILHPTYKTNQPSTARNSVDSDGAEGSALEAVVDEERKGAESSENATMAQIVFALRCTALLVMATFTIMVRITSVVQFPINDTCMLRVLITIILLGS